MYEAPDRLRSDGPIRSRHPEYLISARYLTAICLLLVLALSTLSCDESVTEPAAANSLTGMVDGTVYTAENVLASRDSTGLFSVSGTIREDAFFRLLFVNPDVTGHPVQEDGPLRDLLNGLDSLFQVLPSTNDSTLADSLVTGLESLLAEADDPLSADQCFAFYLVGDLIYFTESGNFILDEHDADRRRIFGSFEFTLRNFLGGQKTWTAELDDIEYIE